MHYHVREMVNLLIRYFLEADIDFLRGMGVDPKKPPAEVAWLALNQQHFARLIQQRHFYYLVREGVQ